MDSKRLDEGLALHATAIVQELGADQALLDEVTRQQRMLLRESLLATYTVSLGLSKRGDIDPRARECQRALANALVEEVMDHPERYGMNIEDTRPETLLVVLIEQPAPKLLGARYNELLRWLNRLVTAQLAPANQN